MEERGVTKALQSRIVGHADVPPDQLLAHESNYRRHPGHQLDALRGSLAELGWVKSVLVSKRTGKVLDGHARCEEAMRQDIPTVPVEYVDLTEAEEKLALAVLDPVSEMATRDDEQLMALLSEVHTDDEGLQAMFREMAEDAGSNLLDGNDPANDPQDQETATLIVDCDSLDQRDRLSTRLQSEGFSCRKASLPTE
jgi:hypothetical protein